MRVPLNLPEPVVKSAVAATVSIVLALAFALAGGLGQWSSAATGLSSASATVVAGASCSSAGPERVRFTQGGGSREALLDACGHAEGEVVEISVGDGEVVHLVSANTGTTFDARPVGVVLMIFAGIAGAGMVELWQRTGLGGRTRRGEWTQRGGR
ncbi:hypothetical protein [Actinokineospora spheciospongiae]|uniref:hypothetical protein n=1 Tax=Actinokineospora spheciospongiae TaxID=909613 RepID=UPI000D71B952|nr:hypothetical protein [Actinokineospora spheciospongiae]PWW65304.1 hypothetical protein DFQ13_10254 [Actinokineospora spheciospongiae]